MKQSAHICEAFALVSIARSGTRFGRELQESLDDAILNPTTLKRILLTRLLQWVAYLHRLVKERTFTHSTITVILNVARGGYRNLFPMKL